jgi:phage baseplate assembly protein W
MAKWFGPNFPFYKGNTLLGKTEKVAPRQEDHRLIKNDLLQGLLTVKGERWFRPTFGGDIHNFLFEQNDIDSRDSLRESIIEQVQIFHPRVVLTRVEINDNSSNPNLVVIDLYGRTVLDNTNVNTLLVSFQLPVAGTVGPNAGRVS